MDPRLVRLAEHTIGFMPPNEGLVLYRAALQAGTLGALLEIGSYCGKSAVYLGAGAKEAGTILFSVDHHRGSEEQQPGQEYFDERVVDPTTGRVDTLLLFRRTIDAAGLEDTVIPIVGRSEIVARRWTTPVGLVFIDGGHSEDAVRSDFEGWAPHVVRWPRCDRNVVPGPRTSKTTSIVDAHPPRLCTRYTEKGRRRMLDWLPPQRILTNCPGFTFSPISGETIVSE
jgi:MMP 1-O-methyltransferase